MSFPTSPLYLQLQSSGERALREYCDCFGQAKDYSVRRYDYTLPSNALFFATLGELLRVLLFFFTASPLPTGARILLPSHPPLQYLVTDSDAASRDASSGHSTPMHGAIQCVPQMQSRFDWQFSAAHLRAQAGGG